MILAATCVALLTALPLGAWALFHRERETCTVALADEHGSTASSTELVAQRVRDAKVVLRQRTGCDTVIVGSVTELPGGAGLWVGRLRGQGDSALDRQDDARVNRRVATERTEQAFRAPAAGRANYLAFVRQLDGQLASMPKTKRVEVWIFGSGIDELWPDLRNAPDLSPQTMAVWLDYVGPTLSCRGWSVRFVGVDHANTGGTDDALAINARRWWTALVHSCGGRLDGYGSAIAR